MPPTSASSCKARGHAAEEHGLHEVHSYRPRGCIHLHAMVVPSPVRLGGRRQPEVSSWQVLPGCACVLMPRVGGQRLPTQLTWPCRPAICAHLLVLLPCLCRPPDCTARCWQPDPPAGPHTACPSSGPEAAAAPACKRQHEPTQVDNVSHCPGHHMPLKCALLRRPAERCCRDVAHLPAANPNRPLVAKLAASTSSYLVRLQAFWVASNCFRLLSPAPPVPEEAARPEPAGLWPSVPSGASTASQLGAAGPAGKHGTGLLRSRQEPACSILTLKASFHCPKQDRWQGAPIPLGPQL